MSDSSKQQRSGATPIKNPLLSASVTGLTFDDYPNKPFLLPAAPPIVHAAPVPAVVTPSSLVAREPKSLVTVGSSSSLDTENLDEINLNSSNEDKQSTSGLTADPNANSLLDPSYQENTSDSLLSQAASSFSSLPSVASNVFSTFSKRINAISSRETTPSNEQYQAAAADANANSFVPQLEIQPTYTQQQQQNLDFTQATAPPPQLYAPPQGGNYFGSTPQPAASVQADIQSNLPPPEPPKFYTPAEVPSIPSGGNAPPSSNLGNQNSFRFSSKKKLYAPIPGLSDQNQAPTATLDPLAVHAPISYDNSTYGSYSASNDPYQQPQPQQALGIQQYPPEERKAASGLFSKISNFAPTGVLQNISGLVQSAAGSISQTIRPDLTQSSYNPQPQVSSGTGFDQQSNYFGGPPPPTNFFVPPTFGGQQSGNFPLDQQQQPVDYSNTSLTQPPPPTAVSFYNPQQSSVNLAGPTPPISSAQQSEAGLTPPKVFDPTSQSVQLDSSKPPSQAFAQPTNFFNPLSQTQPPPAVSELFQNPTSVPADLQATSQTQIDFFNPSNLPAHADPSLSYQQSSAQALRPNRPPSRPPSHPSSSYCPQANPSANDQEAVSFYNPTQTETSPQVALFDPTKYLSTPGLPAPPPTSTSSQSIQPSLPPTSNTALPPPAGGHTSYRLQKGTKLYKNPLTAQETAPVQVAPNQIEQPSAPPTVFPSFAPQETSFTPLQNTVQFPPNQGTSQISDANPFRTTASSFLVPNTEPQSVALFAPPPEEEETKSKESKINESSVALFAAELVEEKIPDLLESNLLFAASNPLEALKSEFPTEKASQEPLEQDNTSSFLFKPIEPVAVSESLDQHQTSNFGSFNAEESQPILETIEPVVEEKESTLNIEASLPQSEQSVEDPLEQTLQKLSELTTEPKALTLPPPTTQAHTTNNPYRRGSVSESTKPAVAHPVLANFFTPGPSATGSGDFNFFANLAPSETNKDSGVNFFSNPPLEKETSQTTTEVGSFFQPSIAEPTTQTQSFGFFAPSQPGTEEKSVKAQETLTETVPFVQSSLPESTKPLQTTSLFTPTQSVPEVISTQPDLIPVVQEQTKEKPQISQSIAFFPSLPTNIGVIPSVLETQEDINKNISDSYLNTNVPPPIGFEGFIQQTQPQSQPLPVAIAPDNTTLQQEKTQQPEVVDRFSNYFSQFNQTQPKISKDPSAFFDSFAGQQQQQPQPQLQQQLESSIPPSVVTNEEQRIQYFFNNPPPKDASAAGDLNYDLVHSGLGIKKIQQRSLTPVSNLVEPPSSACSEFSEFSNTTGGQKSIAADLSITDIAEKPLVKEVASLDNTSSSEDSNVKHYEELPEEILKELRMANLLTGDKLATTPTASVSYKPAVKHWFYKRIISGKTVWLPFSHYDSALLETSLTMEGDEKPNIVAVEGGRYDVNISERKKMSVYWDSDPIEVRRCSWFYKAVDSKYVPYEEDTADVLEQEYKQAAESGVWHKTIILGMGEQVNFHGPTVIVHFQQQQNTDAWGGTTQTATRPRVVKRDLDDFEIEQGESQRVDHLLFMVHGIGSACDLKLRTVEEVVEDFRTIARQLVQSHYKNSTDMGLVGRVEVLPISWHSHLHSVEMGIDEKLRMITLESIPKLRNFTNDTLLDILFYTSPTYCQMIMNTIVSSMNAMYLKYRERHPEFNGGVSLAGHSLGSLILFDLLCHQNPIKESEEKNMENPDQQFLTTSSGTELDSNQLESNNIGYTMGPAGTGQPFINYGQLIFQPKKFFALGSPIGMFVTIRGIDKLGLDFRLPTCPGFYNIFHPYDPVAYRIEALVNTDLSGVRPVLIPHHKGRKRMHLELKETMTRVSMDLKQRFLDKFKTTLDSVNIFGASTKSKSEAEELMEKEVEKVIQMQIQLERQGKPTHTPLQDKLSPGDDDSASVSLRPRTDSVSTALSDDMVEIDFPLGKLNDSKRIDYVLQEAPLEFFNEYLFALSSHVCYWDSNDTILFVMKEIYSGLGISPDSQVPQQTMTIERPSSRNSLSIS